MKKSEEKDFKPSMYNETTFYKTFIQDLENAKKEVIILSPFVLSVRMEVLFPIFEKLFEKKVKIFVMTRPPKEYSKKYQQQGEKEIQRLEQTGVQVLISKNDNRKIAIIDREILWEGSLNILSQVKSRDIMFRTEDTATTQQMFDFLNLKSVV
jgi:phosphatidylserine/phosphatidylglycerophosphate/cardiolipin synthase-like enzyme